MNRTDRELFALLLTVDTFEGASHRALPDAVTDRHLLENALAQGMGYGSDGITQLPNPSFAQLTLPDPEQRAPEKRYRIRREESALKALELRLELAKKRGPVHLLVYLSSHGVEVEKNHLLFALRDSFAQETPRFLSLDVLLSYLGSLPIDAVSLLLNICRNPLPRDQKPLPPIHWGLLGPTHCIFSAASEGNDAFGLQNQEGQTCSRFAAHFLRELAVPPLSRGTITLTMDLVYEGLKQRFADDAFGLSPAKLIRAGDPEQFVVAQYQIDARSPFRPFAPFTEGDDGIFYGRTQELAEALGMGYFPHVTGTNTSRPWLFQGTPHVQLVGPPGVGKTSFLRAGLYARLRKQRQRQKHHPIYINARDSRYTNVAGICKLNPHLEGYLEEPKPQSLYQLVEALHTSKKNVPEPGLVLFFFDQFESFFEGAEARVRYDALYHQLDELLRAYPDASPPYRLVFSLHDGASNLFDQDFGKPHTLRELLSNSAGGFAVRRLSFLSWDPKKPEHFEAIARPFESFGYTVTPEVIERLLQEIQIHAALEPGTLSAQVFTPYLQIVCHRLFRFAVESTFPRERYVLDRDHCSNFIRNILPKQVRDYLPDTEKEVLEALEAPVQSEELRPPEPFIRQGFVQLLRALVGGTLTEKRRALHEDDLLHRARRRLQRDPQSNSLTPQTLQTMLAALLKKLREKHLLTHFGQQDPPYWELTHDLLAKEIFRNDEYFTEEDRRFEALRAELLRVCDALDGQQPVSVHLDLATAIQREWEELRLQFLEEKILGDEATEKLRQARELLEGIIQSNHQRVQEVLDARREAEEAQSARQKAQAEAKEAQAEAEEAQRAAKEAQREADEARKRHHQTFRRSVIAFLGLAGLAGLGLLGFQQLAQRTSRRAKEKIARLHQSTLQMRAEQGLQLASQWLPPFSDLLPSTAHESQTWHALHKKLGHPPLRSAWPTHGYIIPALHWLLFHRSRSPKFARGLLVPASRIWTSLLATQAYEQRAHYDLGVKAPRSATKLWQQWMFRQMVRSMKRRESWVPPQVALYDALPAGVLAIGSFSPMALALSRRGFPPDPSYDAWKGQAKKLVGMAKCRYSATAASTVEWVVRGLVQLEFKIPPSELPPPLKALLRCTGSRDWRMRRLALQGLRHAAASFAKAFAKGSISIAPLASALIARSSDLIPQVRQELPSLLLRLYERVGVEAMTSALVRAFWREAKIHHRRGSIAVFDRMIPLIHRQIRRRTPSQTRRFVGRMLAMMKRANKAYNSWRSKRPTKARYRAMRAALSKLYLGAWMMRNYRGLASVGAPFFTRLIQAAHDRPSPPYCGSQKPPYIPHGLSMTAIQKMLLYSLGWLRLTPAADQARFALLRRMLWLKCKTRDELRGAAAHALGVVAIRSPARASQSLGVLFGWLTHKDMAHHSSRDKARAALFQIAAEPALRAHISLALRAKIVAHLFRHWPDASRQKAARYRVALQSILPSSSSGQAHPRQCLAMSGTLYDLLQKAVEPVIGRLDKKAGVRVELVKLLWYWSRCHPQQTRRGPQELLVLMSRGDLSLQVRRLASSPPDLAQPLKAQNSAQACRRPSQRQLPLPASLLEALGRGQADMGCSWFDALTQLFSKADAAAKKPGQVGALLTALRPWRRAPQGALLATPELWLSMPSRLQAHQLVLRRLVKQAAPAALQALRSLAKSSPSALLRLALLWALHPKQSAEKKRLHSKFTAKLTRMSSPSYFSDYSAQDWEKSLAFALLLAPKPRQKLKARILPRLAQLFAKDSLRWTLTRPTLCFMLALDHQHPSTRKALVAAYSTADTEGSMIATQALSVLMNRSPFLLDAAMFQAMFYSWQMHRTWRESVKGAQASKASHTGAVGSNSWAIEVLFRRFAHLSRLPKGGQRQLLDDLLSGERHRRVFAIRALRHLPAPIVAQILPLLHARLARPKQRSTATLTGVIAALANFAGALHQVMSLKPRSAPVYKRYHPHLRKLIAHLLRSLLRANASLQLPLQAALKKIRRQWRGNLPLHPMTARELQTLKALARHPRAGLRIALLKGTSTLQKEGLLLLFKALSDPHPQVRSLAYRKLLGGISRAPMADLHRYLVQTLGRKNSTQEALVAARVADYLGCLHIHRGLPIERVVELFRALRGSRGTSSPLLRARVVLALSKMQPLPEALRKYIFAKTPENNKGKATPSPLFQAASQVAIVQMAQRSSSCRLQQMWAPINDPTSLTSLP